MSAYTRQILLIFIGCSFHLVPAIAQIPPAECITPTNETGRCIELKHCAYIVNLLQVQNLTQENILFLQKSQCGYTTFVWICCPQRTLPEIEKPSPIDSLPKYPDCGRRSIQNRVYGGTVTYMGEFPWMAQLLYRKSTNQKSAHCAGSLIHKRFVLTAAHCAVGRDIPSTWELSTVRLGEWDTLTNPDCELKDSCAPEYQDIDIEKVFGHSEYNSTSRNQHHDIALLKLITDAVLSEFVSIICLPTEGILRHKDFERQAMDIAGWGRTEVSASTSVMLKAEVTVWNLSRCNEVFSKYNISVGSLQMCAGGQKGIDGCRGDSGGPLMLQDQENTKKQPMWYLSGIISLGISPCGLEGWPGIYTRTGAYINWIAEIIAHET